MTAVVLLLGWTRQESRMIFTVREEWQGFLRQGTNVLKWQTSRSHPRIDHSNFDTSALASAGPTFWNLMLALHLLTCCIRHTTSGLPTTWSLGAQDGQLNMISHLCQLAVWQYETPVYNQKHAVLVSSVSSSMPWRKLACFTRLSYSQHKKWEEV